MKYIENYPRRITIPHWLHLVSLNLGGCQSMEAISWELPTEEAARRGKQDA